MKLNSSIFNLRIKKIFFLFVSNKFLSTKQKQNKFHHYLQENSFMYARWEQQYWDIK